MASIPYLAAPTGQDGNFFGGFGGYEAAPPPPETTTGLSSSSGSSPGVSNSVVIIVIVFSVTVIASISLCFLIRAFGGRRSGRAEADEEAGSSGGAGRVMTRRRVQPVNEQSDELPIITFESANNGGGGGGGVGGKSEAAAASDCAICLSKFEPKDRLRLLPICCHAFHAECVDAWLESNDSCPLCRAAIFLSEAEILQKVLAASSPHPETGSISSLPDPTPARNIPNGPHDPVIDQPAQVAARPASLVRALSEDKMDQSNRNWLRDYLERLSSQTASFRSSGGYYTGSSRRSEVTLPGYGYWDVEAGRAGEEISEMFRWFSGI